MTEGIEALMQKGDWQGALAQAEAMRDRQPISAKLNAYVGLCYYRLHKLEQAAVALERAVLLDENYFDAGLKLVQTLDRLQRYEKALEYAEHFTKVDPNDPTLMYLYEGLRRHVPEKITDSWQRSVFLDRHHVELTQSDV